jgi:hypothetical protein
MISLVPLMRVFLGCGQLAVRSTAGGKVRLQARHGFQPAGQRKRGSPFFSAVGVQMDWGWQGLVKHLDQCELQVDRADAKGWVVLNFDTTPGYTDTTPFPAALTKWKYRAIYRVDDHPVGQWSAEVNVNVDG